jgi:hypothetical protein
MVAATVRDSRVDGSRDYRCAQFQGSGASMRSTRCRLGDPSPTQHSGAAVALASMSVVFRLVVRVLLGRSTPDHHAATAVCWFNTAPIFCQPSILRNLICPLATRLKSRTSAASSVGSEPCVFIQMLRLA